MGLESIRRKYSTCLTEISISSYLPVFFFLSFFFSNLRLPIFSHTYHCHGVPITKGSFNLRMSLDGMQNKYY